MSALNKRASRVVPVTLFWLRSHSYPCIPGQQLDLFFDPSASARLEWLQPRNLICFDG